MLFRCSSVRYPLFLSHRYCGYFFDRCFISLSLVTFARIDDIETIWILSSALGSGIYFTSELLRL